MYSYKQPLFHHFHHHMPPLIISIIKCICILTCVIHLSLYSFVYVISSVGGAVERCDFRIFRFNHESKKQQ